MANALVTKIGQATKHVWPEVSAAVAATTRSMQELAGLSEEVVPLVEEYVAKSPTGSLRRRKVCEETIWVLAKLGWLRTGPERDLVSAARAWFDATEDHEASDDEIIQTEEQLADVIRSLPEYVDNPQEVPA